MFNVGDQVVRKKVFQNANGWPFAAQLMTVESEEANGSILLKEETEHPYRRWSAEYFDLVQAAPPAPKFKVGDRVQTFNSQYSTLVEEVVTITEFRYKLNGFNDRVRESKIHASTLPRQIRIDGVNYREVMQDDVSTGKPAEQTKACKCGNC